MKNIVIIGAGPAGLTAAYELLSRDKKKEYSVTVLEAEDAVGGISRTVLYNGNRMDLGGHRFFSKDKRVENWWFKLMPFQGQPAYDDKKLDLEKAFAVGGPDPEAEDRVTLLRRRVSRIYYDKCFYDYPVALKWQTLKNMGLFRTVSVGLSYLKAVMHRLPETSLENFYINSFGRKLYSMFFEGYTEKLWGRHPRDIAADWGSQRVKGLSIVGIIKNMLGKLFAGKEREVNTSLIEEFIYPKYGPGQLWETAAEEINRMGGRILLNHQVVGVKLDEQGNIAKLKVMNTISGKVEEIEADIYVSSIAIKDLLHNVEGTVPEEIKTIAEGLPYRDFVTLGVLVKAINLKNTTDLKTINNIIPDCWIYVQDAAVKLGRIQVFNNWSPYMVKDVENTLWLGLEYFCTEGDSFWNMTSEEARSFAAKELVTMGILDREEQVLDCHRERVKKAYPAYFDTYKDMDKLVAYLNTIDNLYCIGRNGQHRYNNMDHSMVTAFEVVENILTGRKDRSPIWNVNIEQDYHEKK